MVYGFGIDVFLHFSDLGFLLANRPLLLQRLLLGLPNLILFLLDVGFEQLLELLKLVLIATLLKCITIRSRRGSYRAQPSIR
jgi:hypothetical protein